MEHKALYSITLPFSEKDLIAEAKSYLDYQPYHDTVNNRYIDSWLQRHVDTGLANDLCNFYKEKLHIENIRPRYYIQKNTYNLPWHKDRGTQCSLNFVLGGSAPISFRDGDYYYKYAILNTQEEHAVFHNDQTQDRILLKLSVFDYSFDEVVDKYKTYL